MTHHDVRLVRMYEPDGSLHCDVHGKLNDAEAEDVWRRAGVPQHAVSASFHMPRRLRMLAAFLDFAMKFQRPKCWYDA